MKIEIEKRAKKEERVLITTLTKRMAEDLCDFFLQEGIRVRYLHSGIKSIERVEILRDLRLGEFDVLIGVNLLREGLDIPEVSLVAIMDADKEGFLRSETSLIQTIGRAARNACGEVIMYADKITDSMQKAIDETNRRREIQIAHNKKFGIIPQTIKKPIENNLLSLVASYRDFEDIVAEEMVDLGIDKKDLIVDALAMTISTDSKNAIETLKAVDYIKHTLGVNTVLGVSNISFGLPNREAVNTAFYTLCLKAGLSAGIINPKSQSMMNAYYSYNALAGLDENCTEYIESAVVIDTVADSSNITLLDAIVKGMKEESAKCARKLLKTQNSLDIINEYIIPALDKVGDGFEKNKIFLPQLLMSADSAKAAFDEIKAHMIVSGNSQVKGEKIIIATVEGDIHDIGKNIVKVLLANYGFDVVDLGKDVKCETVLDETIRNDAKLVGLSALMTTTVPNMEKTIKLIHENTDAKVFVGGAVLTKDYAKMINADWYAKDAMESVRIAQEFFTEGSN